MSATLTPEAAEPEPHDAGGCLQGRITASRGGSVKGLDHPAARLPSPAAGVPREPGDSPPVFAVVGQRLVQVLLLTDEIKNVGGIAMEGLALEPGRSIPPRPGRGRRAGIRRRW